MSTPLKKLLAWATPLLGVLILSACGSGHSIASEPLELTILHINDHHSNLDSKRKTLQLANAAGERIAVSVDAGGFPRLTAAFTELGSDSHAVLKLHAGDALTGTLYFGHSGEQGEADAAMMNTVCFDAFTLGNHEFDKGDTALRQWLDLLHSGPCQTPVLSANTQFGANSALHPSRAAGLVQPYTVVERKGHRIGIVGLTIAVKTKTSSSPDPDTQFEDEITAAQRAIDDLKAQGINKIVLLTHIGYDFDKHLLSSLSGVDVVIGGDSHSLLGPDTLSTYGVGTPAGPYAGQRSNLDGETVCLAQAWEYAQAIGELRVKFDSDGRVTGCEGTPQVLIGNDFQVGDTSASEADRRAFEADILASGFLRVTTPDAAATTLLQPYRESIEVFKETVVATAPTELCLRRVPGGPGSIDYGSSSVSCNAEASVDLRGGDIQQFVAQAYLDIAELQYGGADFSLQSGGGVRVPLEGTITAANVIEVLPFDNKLWKLIVTGAEAKAMVEDGLEAVFGSNGSTGAYPYTGGLRWDVDASQPRGARVTGFEVYHRASGAWLPLDESHTYQLFVPYFNAKGGDGYTTLANITSERRIDVGAQDVDMLMDYIHGLPTDADGLPVIRRLHHSLYSTKSFIGPASP